jgi:hypothetical protein
MKNGCSIYCANEECFQSGGSALYHFLKIPIVRTIVLTETSYALYLHIYHYACNETTWLASPSGGS